MNEKLDFDLYLCLDPLKTWENQIPLKTALMTKKRLYYTFIMD